MSHTAKSPPAATGGARNAQCLAACDSENSNRAKFLQCLAYKVEDERRRIDGYAQALDGLVSDIDIGPDNIDLAAENAVSVCMKLSRLADALDRHADFLLDLDEALRRLGGVAE